MLTFDVSADYQVMDGLQAVTYYRRLTASTFDAGTAVANAFYEPASKEELIAAGASLKKTGRAWDVWGVQVGLPAPKVNDVVQDSGGVRWSVLAVSVESLATRYRLTTVREV